MNRATSLASHLGPQTIPSEASATPATPQADTHAPLRADVFVGHQRLEVHARNAQELWRQTSQFEDLPNRCGLCTSVDLAPSYRRVREFSFYSIQCRNCRAHLPLGQRKDGGLFPKHLIGWTPARHPIDASTT
jgi:hypothetical protein